MRSKAIPAAAAVIVVVLAAIAVLWLRPDNETSEPTPGSAPPSAPEPSSAVAGADVVADSETLFINATAAQLCAAQSQVYDTPEALAAAYAKPPDYTDLTPEQVDGYKARLTDDPAFSNRLTTTLTETCNPAATPPKAGP